MGGNNYPITGVHAGKGPRGEVPVKMEVDDWWTSEEQIHVDQRSLVTQALNKLYAMDPADKLGYFQIGGIHNQPIVPWDDAPFENKNYCMHNSPNFPTWHRPYNALLEQRIHDVMVDEIIPKFPAEDQPALKKAADNWRYPFWDFAAKKPQNAEKTEWDYDAPLCIKEPEVEVKTPTGTEKIHNPFYTFKMPGDYTMGDDRIKPNVVTREPYCRSKATSRHAYVEGVAASTAYDTAEEQAGSSNSNGIKDQLQAWKWETGGALTGSLRDWFYRVLLITPYETFATNKADLGDGLSGKFSSCEDIHDIIHDWGGGTFGHMGAPSCGAMDPLFWFHHNNVDRMFELWVALHPKEFREWLETDEDAQVPLIPFRKDAYGNFHSAQSVWQPENFGYTYPETQRWKAQYKTNGKFDEEKLAAEVALVVNQKYNSAAAAARKSALTSEVAEAPSKTIDDASAALTVAPSLHDQIVGATQTAASAIAGSIRGLPSPSLDVGGISALPKGQSELDFLPNIIEMQDYVANVIFEKYALDGHPFSIRFFIGDPPTGSINEIAQALTQVGEIYNFVDPVEFDKPNCENCAKAAREKLKITGQVPLTNALITRWKQKIPHPTKSGDSIVLKSMDPYDVVPFLRETFNWRVTDREGNIIDNSSISSMKVAVATGTAQHTTDGSALSVFGGYKILYDVTADAESGTGARPEDRIFKNKALDILGIAGEVSRAAAVAA